MRLTPIEQASANMLARVVQWEAKYKITPVAGQTVEERLDALRAHLSKRIETNNKFLASLDRVQVRTSKTLNWVKYAINGALIGGILAIVNHCAP